MSSTLADVAAAFTLLPRTLRPRHVDLSICVDAAMSTFVGSAVHYMIVDHDVLFEFVVIPVAVT